MKTILFSLLLVSTVISTVVPHVGPIDSHVPRVYKVKADDPPAIRWRDIMKDYLPDLQRMMLFFDLLPIPAKFFEGAQWWAKNMYKHQDFVNEIDAMAKLSGLPFDKLLFLNFMYEFSTFKACSSILVRNSEGRVIHGRNMDFQMWELISSLIVTVEYYRNDVKIYTIDNIAGMAMALTGIRHGAFAITQDTRFTRQFNQDLISILKENNVPSAWLVKKVFDEEKTYQSAVARLKTVPISSPIYFIVSGLGKGIVIEREIHGVHAAYELTDDVWFLVQTNYDRDQKEPIWDPRRIPVEKTVLQRGNKNFNEQTMFSSFMSQWPTFNIATILSTVMAPDTGFHNITVWYGHNPA